MNIFKNQVIVIDENNEKTTINLDNIVAINETEKQIKYYLQQGGFSFDKDKCFFHYSNNQ